MHIRGLAVQQPCRQTFTLVSSLIPFRSQTFVRSLPNATLAFTVLAVTSLSMRTALESASKIGEFINNLKFFCPFTVMVGSLYVFLGAGWCTTSVFFVLIIGVDVKVRRGMYSRTCISGHLY